MKSGFISMTILTWDEKEVMNSVPLGEAPPKHHAKTAMFSENI